MLEIRINKWLEDTSKVLDISNLDLKEWPELLQGKEYLVVKLDCSNNQLESLPELPNLNYLNCRSNQLKSLPNLPNLTELWCGHNQLKKLLKFSKLIQLECSGNKLKTLYSLQELKYLDCSNNYLESLLNFPKLTTLICSFNCIKSLPVLPNLNNLYCSHNWLKSLPNFPHLHIIDCFYNQLFSDNLYDWARVWKLQNLRRLDLRKRGLVKVIKRMKLRLYLPRLTNLHQELTYSPHHPGKFYKLLRQGDWSCENNKSPKN